MSGHAPDGAGSASKAWALHAVVILGLLSLHVLLPDYHHGIAARIMVLAVFAMGYNLLFGYTGLLSLGHAMFFAAGLYGAGLPVYHLGWSVPVAFATGIACGGLLALAVGVLALRTTGVAFMIVTMMFSQVAYLMIYWLGDWTRGDEGLTLSRSERIVELGPIFLDLTDRDTRFLLAWALFSAVLVLTVFIARSPFGRVLVAIRENEERTRMLGYNAFANKLSAVVLSGLVCAMAGAAYGLLFGYVGATFGSIQYSILPLLWVLLGGAATTLGPLIGTYFMFYIVDFTQGFLRAYMLLVGVALILLVLFFPKGILGTIRERWLKWLP
ncbi:MAG: branched-chain amino acid ABC transporter permease [Mesorhizobium sp.]|nr:branched-chain amino acid ABC transporter permease [Mesorhizobium sp.]